MAKLNQRLVELGRSLWGAFNRFFGRRSAWPRSAAWYIEARPFNEVAGKPAQIPAEPPVKGSGVAVRLEHLERSRGTEGQEFWTPKKPPDIRRYLLTCAHVVRGYQPGLPGWNPQLGEILCWPANSRYLHWDYPERRRNSGEWRQIGACRARVAFAPYPGVGPVPGKDAIAINDWVLLELQDGPNEAFAGAPTVEQWRYLEDPDDRAEYSVVGFPGGDINWKHNDEVVPHQTKEFRIKRETLGGFSLVGPQTARGMSGGPIFTRRGAFVGIHRAATEEALERHCVSAAIIAKWLDERGLRPAPARSLSGRSRKLRLLFALLAGIATVTALARMVDLCEVLHSFAPLMNCPEPASMCVSVTGGEEPSLLQPISHLQLKLIADDWPFPGGATGATTDSEGKACFNTILPYELSQRERLPFYIRCENAPGPLTHLAPVMVHPAGITQSGLKQKSVDMKHYLQADTDVVLAVSVFSEAKWLAAQMSQQVFNENSSLNSEIAAASVRLGLNELEKEQGLAAWSIILQSRRPVVATATLSTSDDIAIRNVASAVGAFYEDDAWRGTGFAISSNAVLVPSFVLSNSAQKRSITFGEVVGSKTGEVSLGRVLWRSAESGVALLEARGKLPAPPALSEALPAALPPRLPIYVIGYPGEDQRTPTELRSIFKMQVRTAMFGEYLKPGKEKGTLEHDATTTGGTAGGPLVDRSTNSVIGVHLSGYFQGSLQKVNSAVSMGFLLEDPGLRAILRNDLQLPLAERPAPSLAPDPLRLDSQRPLVIGYDPEFLAMNVPLPIPVGKCEQLAYLHYSVCLNQERRTARYAAVNVERSSMVRIRRRKEQWVVDPRLPRDAQPGEALFSRNLLDRGQLIPYTALTWGSPDLVEIASRAAFYWPNVMPQHQDFNRDVWARLEKQVYERLFPSSLRLSVFVGPVENPADINYRGYRIPRQFWLVALYQNPAGKIPLQAAYLVEQYEAGEAREPDEWPRISREAREVPISEIERQAKIRFQLPLQP